MDHPNPKSFREYIVRSFVARANAREVELDELRSEVLWSRELIRKRVCIICQDGVVEDDTDFIECRICQNRVCGDCCDDYMVFVEGRPTCRKCCTVTCAGLVPGHGVEYGSCAACKKIYCEACIRIHECII
jgi:hypothetical protein